MSKSLLLHTWHLSINVRLSPVACIAETLNALTVFLKNPLDSNKVPADLKAVIIMPLFKRAGRHNGTKLQAS